MDAGRQVLDRPGAQIVRSADEGQVEPGTVVVGFQMPRDCGSSVLKLAVVLVEPALTSATVTSVTAGGVTSEKVGPMPGAFCSPVFTYDQPSTGAWVELLMSDCVQLAPAMPV